MSSLPIALQLYTLREATARDMPAALRRVAAIGYHAVEFAGWGNAAPRDIRHALAGEGIRPVAAHVPLEDLERRRSATLDACLTVGVARVVIPSVPARWTADPDGVRRLCARLDELGAAVRAEGLRLAYHNHDVECRPLPDGSSPWSVLVERTDRELVDLELDLYWAAYAGADPVDTLRASGGRARLLHAKDISADASRQDEPVGEGVLPWPALLAAGVEQGVEWYIVEQDRPRDPFADVERSLVNLRRLAAAAVAQ